MLHEFLTSNRAELIRRCREKVGKRQAPPVTASELEYGVPLFLEQLIDALRLEQANASQKGDGASAFWKSTPGAVESSRTAALHGEELLAKGYNVDQVVHGYGDICQSITELAEEESARVTVEEFHTFNRLLDNAIADAVASFGRHRDQSISARGERDQHEWRGALGDEQRTLLDTAAKAFQALKVGNIGLRGATGTLLEQSLTKLRDLMDKSLPPQA